MPLKFYRLVIDEDTSEISLFLVDSDGNINDDIGLKGAKELFEECAMKIDRRLRNQKSDTERVLSTEYPFGYPDAVLQE